VKRRMLDDVSNDGIEFRGGRFDTARLFIEWPFAFDVDKRQSAFSSDADASGHERKPPEYS